MSARKKKKKAARKVAERRKFVFTVVNRTAIRHEIADDDFHTLCGLRPDHFPEIHAEHELGREDNCVECDKAHEIKRAFNSCGMLRTVEFASQDERLVARTRYGEGGQVEVDKDALVSRCEDKDDGVWVQAWLFVPRRS